MAHYGIYTEKNARGVFNRDKRSDERDGGVQALSKTLL